MISLAGRGVRNGMRPEAVNGSLSYFGGRGGARWQVHRSPGPMAAGTACQQPPLQRMGFAGASSLAVSLPN
jgi:hypothetical protein